ncbi:MAG: O-antigen ligase family protein [Candidatus Hydrogenedentes bacterium]|nr:O-antigen ligase family protein [Candidatus Hydrogenedentota bacterium]
MQYQHRIVRILHTGIALYAVTLVLAVFPYSSLPTVDIKILITHMASFILLAVYGLGLWRGHAPARYPRLLLLPIIIFTTLYAFAALASPYPENALVMTARLFSCAGVYFITAIAFSYAQQVSRLLITVVIAVGVASVYGFIQCVGLDPLPWDISQAAQDQLRHLPSTFGNPNLAGHVLTLAVLCSVYLAAQPATRWAGLLLPLFLAHLMLTQHRASWVGLAIAVVFAVTAWRTRAITTGIERGVRSTITRFVLVVIGIGVVATAVLAMQKDFRAPTDTSLLLRYNAFYSGAQMVVDRPLLGFGPDNYRIFNIQYWTPYEQEHFARNRMLNEHPHNEFLFAAISAGVPGLLLYIFILSRTFVSGLAIYFGALDVTARHFGLMCATFALVFAVDGMLGFNLCAPVSGGLLFLILGALDGVYTAAAPNHIINLRRYRAAVTASVMISSICAGTGIAVFASQVYIARGQSAMYWKYYNTAAAQFDRAATLTPWNWMPFYYEARTHAAAGDLTRALRLTNASLELNPQYVSSLLDAAFFEFNLAATESATTLPGTLETAREFARRAQKLCPTLPEAEDLLGRAAFLEASRLTIEDPKQLKEFNRLMNQAADHFSCAIAYGASNVNELSELTAKTRAMASVP